MKASTLKPTQVEVLVKRNVMKIQWDHGDASTIPFAELRRHCACSFCRASGKFGEPVTQDKAGVTNAVAMGTTGLQLTFEDGHDRGIYPWGYLHAIGEGRGMDYFDEHE